MEKTLRVINSLESEGVIGRYAIGGAVGLLFYTEPAVTYDLDIFCYLPYTGTLIDLGPLYKRLAALGYQATPEEHVNIEGIPVQFLPPTTNLVQEALDNSVKKSFADVSTEELFRWKRSRRHDLANLPIEEKIKILIKLQHIASKVGRQVGRNHGRPWDVQPI
jgi:hypothetical protein